MGLEGQDAPLAGGARVQNDELEEFFDDDRPQFHIQPPAGWMNDPNGPIYYKGRYHMFYQYLPDACEWDFGIIWGHAYSEDLVHWEHLPPALVPSPGWVDADGCFSGCCVQQRDSGKPMILYTGVRLRSNHDAGALPPSDQDLGMVWIESQCAAIPSENDDNDDLLIHWDKLEIPFLNLPPKGYDLTGWRDPFIVSLAGCGENDNGNSKDLQYTMLIGSGIKGKGGTALVYGSDRLEKDWKLLGLLCEGIAEDTGVVWECPVLLPLPRLPPEYRGAMQSAPLWLHCGRQSKDNKSVADKLSSADLVMKGFVGGTQDSQVRRITGFPKSMPEPPRSLSGFDTGSESDSMKSSSLKSSSFSNKKNPSLSLLAQKLEEVSVSDTTDDNNGAEKESSTEAPSIASRVNSSKPNELDNDYDRFEALKSRVKPLNLHGKVEKEESEDSFRFTNTQEDAVAGDAWYFFTVSPDAPTNPVLYWTGHMQSNGANTCPKFDIDHAKGPYRLDLGDILYAPNVCQDAQGRWLLWGWLQERRKVGSYAYSGCLTVPRVLHVTDEGRLIQAPAREIEKLREKKRAFHAQRVRLHHDTVFPIQQVKSERLDIECSIERGTAVAAGILFRSHEAEAEGSTAIIYDWERNHLEAIFNVPTNWKPVDIAETPKFSGSKRVSEDSGVSCDPAVMLCRSFSHTDSFVNFMEKDKDSPLSSHDPGSPFSSSCTSPHGLDVPSSDPAKIPLTRCGSSLSRAMQRNASVTAFGSYSQQQALPSQASLPKGSLGGSHLGMNSFMRSSPSLLNLNQEDDADIMDDDDLGNLLEDLAAPMRHEEETGNQQSQEPRRVGGPLAMQPRDVLHLRILVDHSCVEVFTGTGEVLTTRIYRGRSPDPSKPGIDFVSFGGHALLEHVSAYQVSSCWRNKPPTPAVRTSEEFMRGSFRNSLDRSSIRRSGEITLSRVNTQSLFEDILSPQFGITTT